MAAPVLKAKITLLALLSVSRVVFAQADAVNLDNHIPTLDNTLHECIAVTLKAAHRTQFGVFVNATLTNKQSVGKCGCKSTVLSYSVLEIQKLPQPPKGIDPPEWTLVYATFAPFKPGTQGGAIKEFPFMLQTAENRPISKSKSVLRLSCAPSQ